MCIVTPILRMPTQVKQLPFKSQIQSARILGLCLALMSLELTVLSLQCRCKHVQPDMEELYIAPSGCREFVPALIRTTLFRRADMEPGETTSTLPLNMLQLGPE